MEQDIQAVKEKKVDQDIQVIKRDGTRESIDLEKIHRVVHWASQDLENISVSQVEINSQLAFFDGIKTEDIHETIIKSAADLISTDVPDYQYLAARLSIFHLRKKAFKSFTPPSLIHHVINLTDLGIYDKDILNKLDIAWLENIIITDTSDIKMLVGDTINGIVIKITNQDVLIFINILT